MTLLAVAGTGTDIGKTYVSAALLRNVHARGIAVAARKPAQSFAPGDTKTDADVLAAATGEQPHDVCPAHRWLEIPLAPPIAADALGLPPFTITDLATETLANIAADHFTLVETAGGARSPIADDGDCADFIAALSPALVLLVADAGLGTINSVRMSIEALVDTPIADPVVVYLNRFDPTDEVHVRNERWLRTREGLDVVTDIEALTNRVLR